MLPCLISHQILISQNIEKSIGITQTKICSLSQLWIESVQFSSSEIEPGKTPYIISHFTNVNILVTRLFYFKIVYLASYSCVVYSNYYCITDIQRTAQRLDHDHLICQKQKQLPTTAPREGLWVYHQEGGQLGTYLVLQYHVYIRLIRHLL